LPTQDEDTRKVLNAMAEKSPSSLKSLNFYAVAASWFRKAWPILTSPLAISNDNWREEIGDIKNKELVEDTVQDDDAYSGEKRSGDEKDSAALLPSNNMNKNAIQSRQHSSNSSLRIRLTMEHEKDYFLLGPSAWMLVKEKFGFDGYEIQRSCVFAGQNQNEVAIQMLDGENAQDPLIIVPPSGRFSFERALQQDNASDIKVRGSIASLHRPISSLSSARHSFSLSDFIVFVCRITRNTRQPIPHHFKPH
jgi:hypothetical protein